MTSPSDKPASSPVASLPATSVTDVTPGRGETVPVDDLTFSCPECPVCDTETATDGSSYWCEGCGVTWDIEGRHGAIGAALTVPFTRCPSCGLNTGRRPHVRVLCSDRWHADDEAFWAENPNAVVHYAHADHMGAAGAHDSIAEQAGPK